MEVERADSDRCGLYALYLLYFLFESVALVSRFAVDLDEHAADSCDSRVLTSYTKHYEWATPTHATFLYFRHHCIFSDGANWRPRRDSNPCHRRERAVS